MSLYHTNSNVIPIKHIPKRNLNAILPSSIISVALSSLMSSMNVIDSFNASFNAKVVISMNIQIKDTPLSPNIANPFKIPTKIHPLYILYLDFSFEILFSENNINIY